MNKTEQTLIEAADKKALEFLEMDSAKKGFDIVHFENVMRQAVFGFRSKREVLLQKRMEIDQRIRVVRMAFSDPGERRKYMRATEPRLLPKVQGRPDK